MIRHQTASACVIDAYHESVLLVHHRLTGRWQFPGGHVEPGEYPHETALREVQEETGVEARLFVSAGIPHIFDEPIGEPTVIMTRLPRPWEVYEIPAPARPDRGAAYGCVASDLRKRSRVQTVQTQRETSKNSRVERFS